MKHVTANAAQETLYLSGMADAIHAAAAEPLEDGTPAEEVDFGDEGIAEQRVFLSLEII